MKILNLWFHHIANLIKFEEDFWLDNCFRLSKKQLGENEQLENILVKFTTEMKRDKFMKSYLEFIKKKKLTPAAIGLGGNHRIFVNEHLTDDMYNLMKEALKLKREGMFDKVHARSSHLMVNSSIKDGQGLRMPNNLLIFNDVF